MMTHAESKNNYNNLLTLGDTCSICLAMETNHVILKTHKLLYKNGEVI
jgi:hypothetical protein